VTTKVSTLLTSPYASVHVFHLTAHRRRTSSQYHDQSSRVSIASNKSITSTVTSLLRRATSKQRRNSLIADSGLSDTTSVFSYTSTATHNTQKSSFFGKLTKQTSEFSLRPNPLPLDADYPRRHDTHDLLAVSNRSRSGSVRSTARSSRKGRSAPPSSYLGRGSVVDLTHVQSSSVDSSGDGDEDQMSSAADFRREIQKVDEERKHLLDAFAGLELSTLIKQQGQLSHALQLPSPPGSEDGWKGPKLASEQMSMRSSNMDVDTNSLKSIGSSRTGSMRKASLIRNGVNRPPLPPSGLSTDSGSLRRKLSTSTISSSSKLVSPVSSPLSPRPSGRLKLGSTSSVNLTRSTGHLPLATVAETDGPRRSHSPPPPLPDKSLLSPSRPSIQHNTVGDEMADIQRRRAEVNARYDARLEYLRARLKGAELREKVLKT